MECNQGKIGWSVVIIVALSIIVKSFFPYFCLAAKVPKRHGLMEIC